MADYCEDCGCRTTNGVCSNCQEEYFIMENQSEDIEFPLSKEFIETADEQRRLLEERERR